MAKPCGLPAGWLPTLRTVEHRLGEVRLARNFRIFEKKRGNRRTGSRKLGAAGEALFFAVFLLLGGVGLAVLITTLVIPEWRVNHEFRSLVCTVQDKRCASSQRDGETLYRPEIEIAYSLAGENYVVWTYDIQTARGNGYSADPRAAEAVLKQFESGRQYTCWYDPQDLKTVVLVRGTEWWVWLAFLVPLSFVIIGGGGLAWSLLSWGKSEERRASLVQRAAQLDLFDPEGRGAAFPTIPNGANLTNSPGTTLRFRLPAAGSRALTLSSILVACLVWNGIVAVASVLALNGYREGHPDWVLTLSILPFALMGLALVYFFFRQLHRATRIGPTLVEISDHPLHPGQPYRVFLSQAGRRPLHRLEVLLVCEEEATFRHGTDTRTETRQVYRQPVFSQDSFEVRRGLPFETSCELTIPGGAMHSFRSEHNEISWKLLVKGAVAGWPDYERSFPVIVHPGPNGTRN